MLADCAIISQCILNQSIAIVTRALGQALITLIEVYTVALNPRRNPSLILSLGLAIREVDVVVQTVVLALDAYHAEQVNISRESTYETVYQSVTLQEVVNQQWVRSRDITMYTIIIYTIAVSIVAIAASCTYLVIEYPC